jgi:hypothetical protein
MIVTDIPLGDIGHDTEGGYSGQLTAALSLPASPVRASLTEQATCRGRPPMGRWLMAGP